MFFYLLEAHEENNGHFPVEWTEKVSQSFAENSIKETLWGKAEDGRENLNIERKKYFLLLGETL